MISILFVFIAGFFNACMDKVSFHYSQSIFRDMNPNYFNPQISWKSKWKNGDPKLGERFFGSSTIFVAILDFWHLSKMLMITSFCAAVVFYKPIFGIVDAILFYLAFSGAFTLFFDVLLISKKTS